MQSLNTASNLAKPDDVYETLINAHDGLSKSQSDALNARLILILLNHVGDAAIINEAVALAKLPYGKDQK